jgi:hypothetical protein
MQWGLIVPGSRLGEFRLGSDVKQGIAFEFEKEPIPESPCIAIMVHPPGQSQVATQEEVEALLKKGAKR